jgi:hypothetical protein
MFFWRSFVSAIIDVETNTDLTIKKGYSKIQTGVPHIFVRCRSEATRFFKSVNARANHSGKCIV